MTLAHRNICFVAGIAAAVISLIIIVIAAFNILPAYPQAQSESIRRSAGAIQKIAGIFLEPAPYVPFITMIGAAIYSLTGIILIYFFFEKTQSPEILFVGLFIISFAFECIRIMIPLKIILELPNFYLTSSSRVLFFWRYFGLFSLFAASICASGLEVQKQQYIILVIAIASLVFAIGIPVDGLSWDTTLTLINDFTSTFVMVQAGIFLMTSASFIISAYTRGSKEYLYIGLGALLAYLGRNILFGSDTWVSPVPGFVILSIGTWLICTKFHRLYLWL